MNNYPNKQVLSYTAELEEKLALYMRHMRGYASKIRDLEHKIHTLDDIIRDLNIELEEYKQCSPK